MKKNIQCYFDYKWKRLDKSVSDHKPVLIVKPIPYGTSKHNFYSGKNDSKNYVNYISDHQELGSQDEFVNECGTKNFEKNFNYIEYSRLHSKKHELETNFERNNVWRYSNTYIYNSFQSNSNKKSMKSRIDLIPKETIFQEINKHSHIWDIVISEKSKELKDVIFNNQHVIADRILRSLFDFPIDAVISYHGDTDHPHLHIMAYQNKNTHHSKLKNVYKIEKRKIEAAKKSYLIMLQNNKKYINKIFDLNHKFRNLYSPEVVNKILIKDFFELNKKLSGTFQFNRLNDSQKEDVKKLALKILNLNTSDQQIQKIQDSYHAFIEECETYYKKYLSFKSIEDRDSALNQLNDIIEKSEIDFYNRILKTAKMSFEIGVHNFNKKDVSNKITEIEKLLNDEKFKNKNFNEEHLYQNLLTLNELKENIKENNIYDSKTTKPHQNKKAIARFQKSNLFEEMMNHLSSIRELRNQYSKLLKEIEQKNFKYVSQNLK